MSRRFDSPYFPKSTPREVSGGIRARSARGKIASTWWSTRFIEVLESTGMGSRLTRGRNYARRGQVLSLELSAGQVTASVQGSRARPYRVRINVTAYGKEQWTRIEDALSGDAWFVAQLLAGEMPPDIEGLFSGLGLALFPARAGDFSLDCSCPDWEVPCKHLAAVCCLLAERFDADPFEVLAWRGRDREDLLDRLSAMTDASDSEDPPVSLTDLLDVFYVSPGTFSRPRPTPSGASLLDQLPDLQVTVRGLPLATALRPAYDAFAGTLPNPTSPGSASI